MLQLSGLEPKRSSSEDLKRLADEEEPAKRKPDEAEKGPSDEDKGGLSPSEGELELADDDDSQLKEQTKKKNKGKKKKGANEKVENNINLIQSLICLYLICASKIHDSVPYHGTEMFAPL